MIVLSNIIPLTRVFVFSALLFLQCLKGFSQHVAAKFDVIGVIPSEIKVIRPSLEVSMGKRFSACLAFEKGDYEKGYTQLNNGPQLFVYHMYGWGLMPELRYYPFAKTKPSPLGFFLGLHYRYRSLTEKYTGEDKLTMKPFGGYTKTYVNVTTTGKAFNTGLDLGYKYNLNVFTLELLGGFGFANGKWNSPNEREHIPDEKNDLTGPFNALRFEVSVGFVFPKVKLDKVLTDVPSVESIEADRQEVAQVIIYRKRTFRGRNLRFALHANDSVAAHVTNGFYYPYILPPGKVKFKARTETSHSVTLTLEKGKTYYLRCRILPGIFLGQPYLEIVPTEIGRNESNALKK